MTFEPTRVHLGKDKDSIENYINANFIEFLGKRVIATQAPISKATFYNFWRMVEQYQVTRIFMLANVIEKAKPKCDRYYPQPTLNDAKLH
jgi:protein tyrosine phosphatase